MENLLIANVVVLSAIAVTSAVILYLVAKKFETEGNPLAEKINDLLPQANCGACGRPGCQDFANICAAANAQEFRRLYCPVGGQEVMNAVADALGYISQEKEPTIAVLRCNGTCQNAPDKVDYIGLRNCRLASRAFVGKTGCPNGCLRFGDCVPTCPFGAIKMNDKTGLPEVNEKKCTSCGICVGICPRNLYEIRPKGVKGVRVYVTCSNEQKGAQARKNCKAACIACLKCQKVCEKITIENNLAYIPTSVSAEQFGKELAGTCPTGAIRYTGKQDA